MKKLLVFALILLAKNVFAQQDTVGLHIPFANNTISYVKVFGVPNAPKNLLYSNSRLSFITMATNGEKTDLLLRDSVLTRIAGKGGYSVTVPAKGFLSVDKVYHFSFVLQIDCKDNKYRCRVYNIEKVFYTTDSNKRVTTHYTRMDDLMNALSQSKGTLGYTKNDIKTELGEMDVAINDLMADIYKKMSDTNNF